MKCIFKQNWIFLIFAILLVTSLSINSFANSEKLVVMFSSGGSGRTLSVAARDFEEKTGIEMEVLTFPSKELREKQILALSQGRPIPDVIAADDTWFAEMWKFLEPLELDEETKSTFIPSMLGSFCWPPKDGAYLALPVRMGGDVIIYREDIFAEHGITPEEIKTWEDFLKVAIELTNPKKREWGYAQGFTPYNYLITQWLNIMGSYGVKVFTPDYQKADFNTKNGIKATQLLVDLVKKASPPGILSYGYWDQVEAMQTGMVTMSMIWAPRFQSVNDPEFPYTGKFKILPNFPYGEDSGLNKGIPRVYGWGLGVNKYSKNKKAAEKFVKFVASEEEQLRLACEYSNSPTVKSVFSNTKYLKGIPIASEIPKAMENGISRPIHPDWNQIEDTIGLQVSKALAGDKSVVEALATAEKEVNKILANK